MKVSPFAALTGFTRDSSGGQENDAVEAKKSHEELRERTANCVQLFEACLNVHSCPTISGNPPAGVRKRILESLRELILEIKSKTYELTDKKGVRPYFGRINLLERIKSRFDPLLYQITTENNLIGSIVREKFPYILPLSETLNTGSIKQIASGLFEIPKEIEDYLDPQTDDIEHFQEITESFHAVAQLIEFVRMSFPDPRPEWCDFCFRRTAGSSRYCNLHRPWFGEGSDTNYKKGRRINSALPNDIKSQWGKYRAARIALGENMDVIYDSSHVPRTFSPNAKWIILPEAEDVGMLVSETLELSWEEVESRWENIIKDELPSVHNKLRSPPGAFESWDVWCKAVLQDIEDRSEETKHPYWILLILYCAEDWFKAEAIFGDNRKTRRAAEIERLLRVGESVTEIAVEKGVSVSNVSKKKNKLDGKKKER